MTISPKLTEDDFTRLYAHILENNLINNYKESIQEFNKMYENTKDNDHNVIHLLKYSVLLEIKMIDYIKNNNPDMVLKFINKILQCMTNAMEKAEKISDKVYIDTCEMAKDDYNRMNNFKKTLESLQS